jgi:hypothetical protein
MHVELSDDEIAVLMDLVVSYLGDLSAEIADTDAPAFRRELFHRRDLLLRVRTALATSNPPTDLPDH